MRTPSAPAEAVPWIERLARVGYVAKGFLYATIGVLAALAAIGAGGRTTDTRGAMTEVLDAPFGKPLVLAMALGLLGYAIWRVVGAFADAEDRGDDAKGMAIRAGALVRGLAHAVLAYSAFRLATRGASGADGASGRAGASGAGADSERSREAAETAMRLPGGEMMLWAVAVGIGAYGLYQLFRAFSSKLGKNFDKGGATAEVGGWVIAASRIGIAARGVVFLFVAYLVGRAASQHDPSQAGGISEALRRIQDVGTLPFATIAVGLILYGLYQFLSARYRAIRL